MCRSSAAGRSGMVQQQQLGGGGGGGGAAGGPSARGQGWSAQLKKCACLLNPRQPRTFTLKPITVFESRRTHLLSSISRPIPAADTAMVTLKGHKRCDHQDDADPDFRCQRQPSFNFYGSVGGRFCHQHKVREPSHAPSVCWSLNRSFADARHG